MATITKSEIKELKDLIIRLGENLGSRMQSLEEGQKSLAEGQKSLEIRQAKIEGRLDEWKPSINKITDLTEKVGELKNWKQIGLVFLTAMVSSIFSGTIGGVIGWLIRGGKV
jgi:chromosome segregation ATPase